MGRMVTLVPHFPTYPDLVENGDAYVDLEAAREVAEMEDVMSIADPEIQRAVGLDLVPRRAGGLSTPTNAGLSATQTGRASAAVRSGTGVVQAIVISTVTARARIELARGGRQCGLPRSRVLSSLAVTLASEQIAHIPGIVFGQNFVSKCVREHLMRQAVS